MRDRATKRSIRKTEKRPDIRLSDGQVIVPRARWARDTGISDRAAARLNPRTVYIGNVAYVFPDEAIRTAVERGEHPHSNAKGRRAG